MVDEHSPYAFPVRYMAVSTWFGWQVIDTAVYVGETVCKCRQWANADRIAMLLNKAEGYVYEQDASIN